MRSRPSRALATLAALALLLALPALLPRAAADDEAPAEPAPRTVAVVRRDFRETLELSGVFVPRTVHEVAAEPEVYGGPFEVRTAAEAGRVVKGQPLVSFDREPIDDEMRRRERDLEVAELKLKQAEEEMRRQEEEMRLALEQAGIRLDRAVQELDLWRRVNRPMRVEQAEFGLQGQEDRIQDQVEELEQLEKMYGADELTEETEEIVLRRARRGLARSRRGLEFSRRRHELMMEVELPQQERDLELAVRRVENEVGKLRATADLRLRQARLELDARREAYQDQAEEVEKLRADRAGYDLVAPAEGLAITGFFRDGKWQKVDETAAQLEPGRKVGARQVLFTIVTPGDVDLETSVEEKDVLRLRVGQTGTVRPAIAPDRALAARVDRIAFVPEGGKHGVVVRLAETDEHLVPGQSGKVEIVVSEHADALAVPAAAVRRDGSRQLVWVMVDGKAKEREVQTGLRDGDTVEVTRGLEAGETVLAEAPKAE